MKGWIPIAVVCLGVAVAAPAAAYMLSAGSIAGQLLLAAKKSDLARLQQLTDVEAVTAALVADRPDDPRVAEYARPKGIRGILRKCDPRALSDRALLATPEVEVATSVISRSRVVLSCTAPEGGEIRLTVQRSGFAAWRIVDLDLPGTGDAAG